MMAHPYPDGTLVRTFSSPGEPYDTYGIVESYIRDYNPCDSFYFILVNGKVSVRDRKHVRPVNE